MQETAVEREGRYIVSILRENGFERDAESLGAELGKLTDPLLALSALETIISMCHVKWLGDKNIKTVSDYTEWWGSLGRLSKAASKAKRKISPV
ncbi:MAG: hypothetical protein KTR29_17760 [Rhodothermaceae bacterium]|nr:hypothetical protein [Rhodothermaceae bacterium]